MQAVIAKRGSSGCCAWFPVVCARFNLHAVGLPGPVRGVTQFVVAVVVDRKVVDEVGGGVEEAAGDVDDPQEDPRVVVFLHLEHVP